MADSGPDGGPGAAFWTLRDRQTFMLRIEADPANWPSLRRMNARSAWAWVAAVVLFAVMGTMGVVIHPGPMLAGATTAQQSAIWVLFAGSVGCGVWGQWVSLQRRRWLAVRAKQLWLQERHAVTRPNAPRPSR